MLKRQREPSLDESRGAAAFQVLTNPLLFRAIQSWSSAFPELLRAKWLTMQTTLHAQHCRHGQTELGLSKKRQVQLFMRELMVRGDLATLKLAAAARWRDPATGESGVFPVHELQFAIRANQAAVLRWAFESTGAKATSRDQIVWFWHEALRYFAGRCDVLDVLVEYARPDDAKYKDVSARLLSLRVARWIVARFGPSHLADWLLDSAARRGDLALVQFLWTVPGQDVDTVKRQADSYCAHVREFVKHPTACASM